LAALFSIVGCPVLGLPYFSEVAAHKVGKSEIAAAEVEM